MIWIGVCQAAAEHFKGRAFQREGMVCAKPQRQGFVDHDGGNVSALELTWGRS